VKDWGKERLSYAVVAYDEGNSLVIMYDVLAGWLTNKCHWWFDEAKR
jgi:hypothetical protein